MILWVVVKEKKRRLLPPLFIQQGFIDVGPRCSSLEFTAGGGRKRERIIGSLTSMLFICFFDKWRVTAEFDLK